MTYRCTDCALEREERRPDLRCPLPGCTGFMSAVAAAQWQAARERAGETLRLEPGRELVPDVCRHHRPVGTCAACELRSLSRAAVATMVVADVVIVLLALWYLR